MVGNLPNLEDSPHAGDVLRRFANVPRGDSYALHAPRIVKDAATAATFRAEESVARTLDMIGKVDIAVVGIGSWDQPSSRLIEVLPKNELKKAKAMHPVADVCAVLFDANGNEVTNGYAERRIGATAQDLATIPMVIGVASGLDKATAIRAALSSGVLNCLVVDGGTASRVLTL